MSLSSILNIEVEREVADPAKREVRLASDGTPEITEELQSRRDILIHAIPTEVLAPYTAVVGVIIATIGAGESQRLILRWILYAAASLAILLYLGVGYLRRVGPRRKRKFPWPGAFAAVFAFGAWGLVMPGSPLSAVLKGDDLTIWTAVITGAGGFLVALMTEPVRKKVKS
jgi:hypothetical protein